MQNANAWIEAARPKTLPLAVSSPLMGSFLAMSEGKFLWSVFIFATITTLLLQILSNLANDYGDYINGADGKNRIGPRRMLQSGQILPKQMKTALKITAALSFLSGVLLIYFGTKGKDIGIAIFFLGLGIVAILAAIYYTVGKSPYGYKGLGDISVFLFFGLIGVLGTDFLHTGIFNTWHIMPATAIGLLCAGVLNLNNLRDYESDKAAKKRTLVVWLGSTKAKYYHLFLIILSALLGPLYVAFNYHSAYQFLFVLAFPLFASNAWAVFHYTNPNELYPELKKLAFTTFIFTLAFGIGMII